MKKLIAAFVALFLVTMLVVACGGGSSSGTSAPSGGNTVHMTSNNFAQPGVTISKGSNVMLVDDGSVTHIISNGSWQNGTPHPAQEPGAPIVSNLTISTAGQPTTIGPFNTAGTFHYYCSVHVGMNLAVVV
jgi:plastocyanin